MPRILGVEIPSNKKIEFSLRYIYGIGPTRAKEIIKVSGFDSNRRAGDLNEEELNKLASIVADKQYLVEGDLRRDRVANLKRLSAIRAYRGLPVRGQRTKTNARTRKGAIKPVRKVK